VTTRTRARAAETPTIEADNEKRVVEALIFVADEPVTLDQMALVLSHRKPDELAGLVSEIERELETAGHGLRIEQVAGGYRFSTCPDLAPWVRAFFRNRNRARLSPASIETLAVIAYKQPVTAPEIQEIRGVDPQGSLKTLLDKRLIRMAGKKKVIGRPFLYATTREFLVHFGLATIDDLPPIEDFERLAVRIEAASGALEPDEGMDPGMDADTSADADDAAPRAVGEAARGERSGEEGPEGEGAGEDEPRQHDRAVARWTDSGADPESEDVPDDDDPDDDESEEE
jgi:segregation and condensation protein B